MLPLNDEGLLAAGAPKMDEPVVAAAADDEPLPNIEEPIPLVEPIGGTDDVGPAGLVEPNMDVPLGGVVAGRVVLVVLVLVLPNIDPPSPLLAAAGGDALAFVTGLLPNMDPPRLPASVLLAVLPLACDPNKLLLTGVGFSLGLVVLAVLPNTNVPELPDEPAVLLVELKRLLVPPATLLLASFWADVGEGSFVPKMDDVIEVVAVVALFPKMEDIGFCGSFSAAALPNIKPLEAFCGSSSLIVCKTLVINEIVFGNFTSVTPNKSANWGSGGLRWN